MSPRPPPTARALRDRLRTANAVLREPCPLPAVTRHPTPIALALGALLPLTWPAAQAQTQTAAAEATADATGDAAPQRVEVSARAAGPLDQRPGSTSRLGLSLRESPASISVVDRAAIDAMQAADSQALLAAVPGVSWSAQPGAPGSLSYRGFGASSLSQLYNGISVQYDAVAARPVDSWLIERAEVVGGASGFLSGTGALGGTVNLVTKQADTRGDLSEARLSLGEARGLGLSLQRALDGAAPGSAQVLRLDAHASRGAVRTQGADRTSGQLALSWRAPLAAGLVHTLALERQHERVEQVYWGTPYRLGAGGTLAGAVAYDPGTLARNYNAVDGFYRQRVTWLRSVLEARLAAATRLTHTLYHHDALRDYENLETYAFVEGDTRVERSNALLQRHDQQVWGSRSELRHTGTLAGRASSFAAGWDWSHNRQTRFPLAVAGPFDRTDPYAPADRQFLATPGVTRTHTPGATNRLQGAALFAEQRTALGGGWALSSALRWDRLALAVTNHRTPSASNPAHFARTFHPLTGRLGLVRDLTPAWQVYAQYSTAADPPAGVLATAGFSALRDFDLTRGRQLELGSKASFDGGRGEATAALYRLVRDNFAMTDPADRTRVLPVGRQSSRGVELAARWRPAAAWTWAGHLAYTGARYDDFVETVGTATVSRTGNTPANTPAWVAGASASWQPRPAWTLRAELRHVGRRWGDSANSFWEGGYTLLGLGARWQLDPRLALQARVDNAGDRVYAATLARTQAVLGAPRSVRLVADLRF